MNEQVLKEAAHLLIRKIQVAVAIHIKQKCPSNKDLVEFAREFQSEYRKRSKRCNLALERKILIDQLLQLEPRAREFLQKSECEYYPLPMEIDINAEIDPIYVNFTMKLISATELLDALNEVRNFFLHYQNISTIDVFIILSKFGDLNKKLKSYDTYSQEEIPIDVFKQALQETDIHKVAKECVSSISKLFLLYLSELPQKSSLSHEEAFNRIKKANRTIIKCVTGFAIEGHYQDIIVDLLHDSIKYAFLENYTKNSHYDEYRIQIVGKWMNNKLLCANVLHAFIHFLGNIKSYIVEDSDKYKIIIKFTKMFLETYCKTHLKRFNTQSTSQDSTNGVPETPEFQSQNKIEVTDKHNLKIWARGLACFVSTIHNDNSCNVKKLTISCIKILQSTGEFKSINKNYQNRSTKN